MNRRGSFCVKFANNKTVKVRSREAFSTLMETMSKGRYSNVGQMYDEARRIAHGFNTVETTGRKVKELERKFNGIDIDD